MILAATSPLWLPLALLVGYVLGIQYERGGWWIVFKAPAAVVLVVDSIMAHTIFPLYLADYPGRGEWTLSQHLSRLIERDDWRGEIARYLKRVLDAIAPSGIHVKPRA